MAVTSNNLPPYLKSLSFVTILKLETLISSEADQCVKCGLCLPHCPTYIKTGDEGDSPRGRIALMQGFAEGHLPVSERLNFHLDRCLDCRACEKACPSRVQYDKLLVATRTLMAESRPLTRGQRYGMSLITQPSKLKTLRSLLRFYQRSGLRALARHSGLLKLLGIKRLEQILPTLPSTTALKALYPATGQQRGQVALFTGCLGMTLDQNTLLAAIRLLTLNGYQVHIPKTQACCGALHLHAGDHSQAQALAQQNIAAFDSTQMDALIYLSSSCGATLNEYSQHHDIKGFAIPLMDINHFLSQIEWNPTLHFDPLPQQIAVHEPCSQRNITGDLSSTITMLKRIPEVKLTALPDNKLCCGAAGSYMLSEAEMADSLRDDKLETLQKNQSKILVSANLGCALHLAAGIRDAGTRIEVLHPIELLARQLSK